MNIQKIEVITDDLIRVDGKAYKKLEEMAVVIAIHPGSNKKYYFDPGKMDINKLPGEYVVVDTIKGQTVAYCVSVEHLQQGEILARGAYLPLKKVLRFAGGGEIYRAYNERDIPF